ncbi:conserved hypothetical protein [Talaromyces stipitatus ATCC 10500]|uniref:Rhodopsin domain-containing protein n=1 Tax=Talaromyces stipitatus (strain ATCC 10500 / CBS 375.48 / QM 6759 / NRRL 1006) TaxID=441959 RepID=B8LV19_TALSN|nr:uncharacterized protein TSTA_061310 [Talaromyces stipitatus ATCC 10500]XP_002340028.1 uncharacterized protein TSTA_061310 [Talaromyces stipitatus ATCC 10500]EED22640.1 conserved hypothetical protein [Talaromyces stipitatus ATCC 10500]EED22641.1 conserved hypothetical protein [Talaromyces stipitatus ATCC 10500]
MSSHGPDDLQPWSIAVTASMTSLAFICVCLRLLSRYERKQALWWDDYMIVFSMVWNLIVVVFICLMIHAGMGLHVAEVGVEGAVLMAKYLVAAEVLYVYNLVWTKLSFLLMYYRIFHFPYFKRWAYIIGGFVIIWVITVTFLFIFICVPVQKLWYPDLPGHCINQIGTWIANASSTIATDLVILILPIPQIWKLQLGKVEKVALTLTFCLGFFVVFASVYRFTVLFSYSAKDPTYTLAHTVGWTVIEMSAGIMSACLPTMRPALMFLARSIGIRHLVSPWGSRNTTAGLTENQGTRPLDSSNNHLRKDSQRAFTRIPDDKLGDRDDWTPVSADASLRPDKCAAMVTRAMGSRGDEESLEGDEVPLHNIRIQTDFKRTDK